MAKIYRFVLFWLARLAGIIGLLAGGKSLGKYAVARFKDPYFDSFSYNDLVFSGGVIFLLSLLVLIFVEVARNGGRSVEAGVVTPTEAKPMRKESPVVAPGALPVAEPVETVESPDEKLARLVKQRGD